MPRAVRPKMSRETARNLSEVRRSLSGLRTKTVRAAITKAPTDGSGTFAALVSTFGGPPDTQGDVISPGAYNRTIAEAKANHPGELWPVWYQHGYENPANAVGIITDAATTGEGLVVAGRLAIDKNKRAMDVYEGLLGG